MQVTFKNLVGALGLALFAAASGCGERNAYVPPPPPEVTIAVPLEKPVQKYFETTGQTRAVQRVELRARVSGYLKEIHFKDGDLVEKGDLLFVIDRAPYQAALASAQATLEKAKAQLQLADQQLARTKKLAERQAATESNLDVQQAEKAVAEAEVASAKAALKTAQLNLDDTEIRAPFAGRMGLHLVDIGNLIQNGVTPLATLESVDPMHAFFVLSESDLLRFMEMIREGEIKISEADPIMIELALGESGEFEFSGRLDFREFGIDPKTGTTQRRAVFPNEEGRLIPGLFVRLRAAVGKPQQRLLVEERAIGTDQRGAYLLTVNDDESVEYRPVELGLLKDGLRAIESGIKPDDRVIVNGLQRARPGSPVSPKLVTMGASLEDDETESSRSGPDQEMSPAPSAAAPADEPSADDEASDR